MMNSLPLDRQNGDSEILELETISPKNNSYIAELPEHRDLANGNGDLSRSLPLGQTVDVVAVRSDLPSTTSVLTKAKLMNSTDEQLDIKAELEFLLKSLEIATPHPPDISVEHDLISDTLAKIAAAEPIAHSQQLLLELRHTREQLATSQQELQSLYHRNQTQVDGIESSVLEVKQVKFRTQQLARHSQNQLQKAQDTLGSFEEIRQIIVTNLEKLEKFGGYAEIQGMLAQLEETRHTLILAHDRLKTGQEAFYESLRAIQEQVVLQSQETEQKIRQDRELIQNLTEAIAKDRNQIAVMSVEMMLKITELKGLSGEITTMHQQIVEKAQTLQASIANIDRGFSELSESVQKEKEQFYELTAGTIDKADRIRSQFADIARQIGQDREAIEQLKFDIESVRNDSFQESEQQSHHFDRQYKELMSIWSDVQVRQKNLGRNTGHFSLWLWILSFTVGVILVLLVTILISLK